MEFEKYRQTLQYPIYMYNVTYCTDDNSAHDTSSVVCRVQFGTHPVILSIFIVNPF